MAFLSGIHYFQLQQLAKFSKGASCLLWQIMLLFVPLLLPVII